MNAPSARFEEISARDMRQALSGTDGLPVEQSECWQAFEESQGRPLWGRYAYKEGEKIIAVIALYEYKVRSWSYLWAKWGPVWVKEASPAREKAFRQALAELVRQRNRRIVFVRMHAWFQSPDLRDLLQTMTYDRTVVVDTSGGTEESILAQMPADGRKMIRRGKKKADEAGLTMVEDTGIDLRGFQAHYEVLRQTAERDGFRPHPPSTYMQMLDCLGPDHARLFSIRDPHGKVLCWDIVLVNDRRAQAEYGASNDEGRRLGAPGHLDHLIAVKLAGEGIRGFDLMGAHSPRMPDLFAVGKYKGNFSCHYTDVAGGWDFVLRPCTYALLETLLKVKRQLG
ncbi:lipid II:glycine glycyltransferase FemX [Schaalia vaccimaxillae]|uniref:lipid II:glycine glycyltransferase FemX n=1 Tax=Schaalia vaccimaxillae TaxID=183916 RepID=UPI0003B567DB|nr:GNAT family N-acetyltransferase [Schaalia vaccimaxillae]